MSITIAPDAVQTCEVMGMDKEFAVAIFEFCISMVDAGATKPVSVARTR